MNYLMSHCIKFLLKMSTGKVIKNYTQTHGMQWSHVHYFPIHIHDCKYHPVVR